MEPNQAKPNHFIKTVVQFITISCNSRKIQTKVQ